MIRVTITLLAVALLTMSCGHNVYLTRYDNNMVDIESHGEYTAIFMPDGTAIVDTQGVSSKLLESFMLGAGGLSGRIIDTIDYQMGETSEFKNYNDDKED